MCDGACGAARRATGKRCRDRGVGGCAVVRVVARHRVGELVGAGDAANVCTRVQQPRNGCGVLSGDRGRLFVGGYPAAGGETGHRENVFDGDCRPGQRSRCARRDEGIADDSPHRRIESATRRARVDRGEPPGRVVASPQLRLHGPASVGYVVDDESVSEIGCTSADLNITQAADGVCERARTQCVGDAVEHPRSCDAGDVGAQKPVQCCAVVSYRRRPETTYDGAEVVGCGHCAKSDRRIRACTPFTRSTTWEMLKSVAALR